MRRIRHGSSRGTALVEFAIIAPLFVLLLFGTIELGYAFMDRETVQNASLTGARVGSSEGTNTNADYDILQAVKKAGSAMSAAKVKFIVVYKASSYSASVPSSCLTASQAGTCNRYTGSNLTSAASSFGCASGALDIAWCPNTRKVALSGANGPPDYIGVYIQGRHDNLTGLFGKGYDFKSDTVIRLEPQRLA